MKEKSKKIQEFTCSGDEHTARSVISRILSLYVERRDQGPGHLFGSDPDEGNPAGKALRAEGHIKNRSEQQRRDRLQAFFRDVKIPEKETAEYLDAVKDWGKCHVNYFARIYVSFWLSALARQIKKVLTNFFQRQPRTVGVVARQSAGWASLTE